MQEKNAMLPKNLKALRIPAAHTFSQSAKAAAELLYSATAHFYLFAGYFAVAGGGNTHIAPKDPAEIIHILKAYREGDIYY